MIPPHVIPPEPKPKPKSSPWDFVYRTLEAMYKLKDGFDGAEAQAPNFDTIELAHAWADMLEHFCQMPSPTATKPGLNANIYFEWQGENVAYREIEFQSEGTVKLTCVSRGGEKWHSGQL